MMYGSEESLFDDQQTLNMIAIADPLSQLVAVFIVPLFSRRLFLIFGGAIIAGMNALMSFFDITNNNLAVTITAVSLVIVTSIMQEPVAQLYMTEVSNNAALGLVHFSYFGSTTIISFILPYLIDVVGPMYLYGACAVLSLVIVIFQFFFLKETAKLTDKEKK